MSLKISVADLRRATGSSRRVSVSVALDGLCTGIGGVPEGRPVAVDARLDASHGGIWFDGIISGSFNLECARCLDPIEQGFSVAATEMFSRDFTAESDDGYPMDGEQIDLEPLVRDAVVLAIPSHALCREECAGLCARCGTDLNAAQCSCETESGHPAFAELAREWNAN